MRPIPLLIWYMYFILLCDVGLCSSHSSRAGIVGIPCTPLHLCLLLTLQLVLVELEAAQLGLHFFPYINLLQSLPLNFVHLDLIFELLYCLEHFQFFTLNLIQLFLNKQPLESHVYLLVDEHVPGGGGEVVVEVV